MSLTYIHLNRLIKKYDLNVIFMAGPGHGAPAVLSNVYLEGDLFRGLRRHFRGHRRDAPAVQAVLLSGRDR